MKVVITGSRDFPFYTAVWDDLWQLAWESSEIPQDLDVYFGDCPQGPDDFADNWCENNGTVNGIRVRTHYFRADWKKHGKAAGPIRNGEMVRAATAEGTMDVRFRAYRLNNSRGTTDCINKLEAAGAIGVIYDLTIKGSYPA